VRKTATYRPDIDGLRALAVVAVIANHLPQEYLPSGFLGVDIFFVISGFVVTDSILAQKQSALPQFYSDFLARRVKRLLPALIACVTITGIIVWNVDPLPEYSLRTGAAALFGVANMVLMHFQLDYFSPSAQFNAFTHTWSLGVEEQFYVVFPFIIWVAYFRAEHRRYWTLPLVLLILSVVSLALFFKLHETNPIASYFLMPTRFWELGIGALTCLGYRSSYWHLPHKLARFTTPMALMGLTATFFAPAQQAVATTVVVVALTSLLLMYPTKRFGLSILSMGPIVYIGKISYSLYLWHWPAVVLAPMLISAAWRHPVLYICSIAAIASLSYHCLEWPLRRAKWSKSGLATIVFGLTISAALGVVAHSAVKLPNDRLMQFPEWNRKLIPSGLPYHPTCVVDGKKWPLGQDTFDNCTVSPRPGSGQPTIWTQGDSHAGHLQGLLYKLHELEGIGVHLIETPGQSFPFERGNELSERESINKKIETRMKPGDIMVLARLFLMRRNPLETKEGLDVWANRVLDLSNTLAKTGVSVIVIGPPPIFHFDDVRECIGNIGALCGIKRKELAIPIDSVMLQLYELEKLNANIHIFDTFSQLCPPSNEYCFPYTSETFLYRDSDHLNVLGSAKLADPFLRLLRDSGLVSRKEG
jgi:peptidoglycan/LPS O-acetylase OafA/YrhL